MKVIFLDIDGVLNSVETSEVFQGFVGIDDKLVSKLRKIVRATGAKIVLSSSWKYDWEPREKHLQNKYGDYLDEKLKKHSLKAIDKTREADSDKRGEGIIEWVGTHEVDSFIILDDEWYDFKELGLQSRVIKTEFYDENGGLTDDHVELAIELLNSEIPN
jgi:hypothetical protein